MKRILNFIFLILTLSISYSQKSTSIDYPLPDSVKAISLLVDFSIGPTNTKKEVNSGIGTDVVRLLLNSEKNRKEVEFEFPAGSTIVATGIGVKTEKNEIIWRYNWQSDQNYKLLLATAGDSAQNFALYSAYIFLPEEKKWKLIGTCKIQGQWNTLTQPAMLGSKPKKTLLTRNVHEVWIQRNNGSWKNMLQNDFKPPVVNLLSHVDSLQQLAIDKGLIKVSTLKPINPELPSDFKQGFIDDTTYKNEGGIYYKMIKEGTGRQVSVNDTVTVFYKGYLLSDNSVFDETKDKPATFPLKRLIVGWQIGVPLCKVGGKIKIIIPSNLAYSIRTRAAKIPPNSILVFEVEVVDAKAPQ